MIDNEAKKPADSEIRREEGFHMTSDDHVTLVSGFALTNHIRDIYDTYYSIVKKCYFHLNT